MGSLPTYGFLIGVRFAKLGIRWCGWQASAGCRIPARSDDRGFSLRFSVWIVSGINPEANPADAQSVQSLLVETLSE